MPTTKPSQRPEYPDAPVYIAHLDETTPGVIPPSSSTGASEKGDEISDS